MGLSNLLLERRTHRVLVDGSAQLREVLLVRAADLAEFAERGDVPAGLENELRQLNRQRVRGFGGRLLGVELLRCAQWTGRCVVKVGSTAAAGATASASWQV